MGQLAKVLACLPDPWKAVLIIMAVFAAGMATGVTVLQIRDLPTRMAEVEMRVDLIENNQRATTCLVFALAADENPHRCDVWMDEAMRHFVAAMRR